MCQLDVCPGVEAEIAPTQTMAIAAIASKALILNLLSSPLVLGLDQ